MNSNKCILCRCGNFVKHGMICIIEQKHIGEITDCPLERLSADTRPVVHGRWEFEYETLDDVEYCCTVCDWIGTNANEYNYCPNCGAKMDGGQDDA